MKIVTRCQSLDGTLFEHESDALRHDFKVLRDTLVRQTQFLSVEREEKQFLDVRNAFESLFHKWQEFKNINRQVKTFKRKTAVSGVSSGREERPQKVQLKRVA